MSPNEMVGLCEPFYGSGAMDAKRQIVSVDFDEQAPRRVAPKGLSRLFTYATGKDILVVGPSGAGKTKFGEYLKWGILSQEGTREMTYHITKSATFAICIGEGGFTLKVRRAMDTPGQTGPVDHATLVELQHLVQGTQETTRQKQTIEAQNKKDKKGIRKENAKQ